MMRFTVVITVLSLCVLCVRTGPAIGIGKMLDEDFIYFPEQAEYVRLASKCPDNMILWPLDRRCYREGEEGPCNIGRILIFDKRYLKPYCQDTILE